MKRQILTSICIAFLVTLPACTSRDKTETRKAATTATNVVPVTATEYAFQAPDTIDAGWSTFRMSNHGAELHYGHIVQLDQGRTVKELIDAYAEAIRTSGPRPAWVTRFGGPGGTAPGDSSSVTQYLEPGSYVWICPVEDESGNPHFGKGEFKSFVVRADDRALPDRSAAPEADMVVRLMDYSFALDTPVVAGKHTIRVTNAGEQPHDLVLMKLAPGRTTEDVQKWLNPERVRRPGQSDDPPPPLESMITVAGGIAVIRPDMDAYFDVDVIPGNYLLVCMTTAPDGRSHIEHGMFREVVVR